MRVADMPSASWILNWSRGVAVAVRACTNTLPSSAFRMAHSDWYAGALKLCEQRPKLYQARQFRWSTVARLLSVARRFLISKTDPKRRVAPASSEQRWAWTAWNPALSVARLPRTPRQEVATR